MNKHRAPTGRRPMSLAARPINAYQCEVIKLMTCVLRSAPRCGVDPVNFALEVGATLHWCGDQYTVRATERGL